MQYVSNEPTVALWMNSTHKLDFMQSLSEK